jgi:Protein of unknown function (DUF998)
MHQKVATWLNAGGIVAPVLWASAVVYSGSLHPEYSHARQYISELAARGSSTQHVMQAAGFVLPGLMTAGFGALLGMRNGARVAGVGSALLIVSGLARAAAGVFVPDPPDRALPPSFEERMHNAAGLTYVVTLPLGALVWFIASQTGRRPSTWFAWYSLVTVVAAAASPFGLIGAGIATARDVGLFQRVSFGLLNSWILVFAAVSMAKQEGVVDE